MFDAAHTSNALPAGQSLVLQSMSTERTNEPNAQVLLSYLPAHGPEGTDGSLPFVIGVIADLVDGGHALPLKPFKDRKFVNLDDDNFCRCIESIRPAVCFEVDDVLTGHGKIEVKLTFESMQHFAPETIAQRLPPLRKLLDER